MNSVPLLTDENAHKIARQVLGLINPKAWNAIREILSESGTYSSDNMRIVWLRLKQFRRPTYHHRLCDWHVDEYPFECTCGATRPKAHWFDTYAQACADAVEQQRREREEEAG